MKKHSTSIVQSEKVCYITGRTDLLEEWKDIKDYEDLYMISNKGNVRIKHKTIFQSKTQHGHGVYRKLPDKKMSLIDNGNGYLYVSLHKNGKRKNYYVHRLVAAAFIGEIGDKVINHLDHNKKNNNVSNLEITNQIENVRYSRERMCKPHHNVSVGNKYIREKDNKFEVSVNKKYLGRFSTLNEAIRKRDDYIEEINYY